MKVALDAQLLSTAQSYRGAGVSNYCRHLVEELGRLAGDGTDDELTAFVNDPSFQTSGVRLERTPAYLQNPWLRIAWEQAVLPRRLRQLGADMVHGLVNVLPLCAQTPGVVTVHDLSFLRLPETLPPAKRHYLAWLCRASVQRAAHVIAVSGQTAHDIVRFFGVSARKIHVIHNGVAEHFRPQADEALDVFRRERGLPARFILYLGTLEPRKNLLVLLRGYAAWLYSAPPAQRDVKLVIAGAKGWFYDEIFRQVAALGLDEMVLFPGFVPDAELPLWYGAAELFVYPSLFEGFGLPVLEAMACGAPVLCSDAESLVEIAGDSALIFPARDAMALASGLQQWYAHPDERLARRQRGLAHVQAFTWRRAAEQTLAVYRQVR